MKNKTILLIRSQDILTDTRVQRYENWYKDNNIDFHILGWDRENKKIERNNTSYYTLQVGYKLGVQAIKYRIKWNIYIFKYLTLNHRSYDIIHACDFDTVIPALCMRLLGKKVIFDIFDWFSDEVKTGKALIDIPINLLEKLAVKCADLTILCEEERLEQIQVRPYNYLIIPNIPNMLTIEGKDSVYLPPKNKIITLGYVGGFYPDRGLEELLNVIIYFPNIKLYIAGFGEKKLEDKIKRVSKEYENVKYYGKVNYEEAINIMNKCNILYGMYYKRNFNNIYAAPNKFYESIFLGKPLITTKGTLVGKKVKCIGSGFVIDEGEVALEKFFKGLTIEEILGRIDKIESIRPEYESKWLKNINEYKEWLENS